MAVEEVAEEAGQDGALGDPDLLSTVLSSDLDDVVLDVLVEELLYVVALSHCVCDLLRVSVRTRRRECRTYLVRHDRRSQTVSDLPSEFDEAQCRRCGNK